MIIDNTTIHGNSAGDPSWGGGSGGGAGILIYYGAVTLNNSVISGNTLLGQLHGSGINVEFGTLALNNSTVSDNGGGIGEGIYAPYATAELKNSTISANTSYGISLTGGATLQNTIIAGNGTKGDCFGSFISLGYNLIGSRPTGCTFVATTGDLVGTSSSPIIPRLTPLQDNGGPTFTLALMSGSPAIDAGHPATPGSGGSACLATDQRGVTRPQGVHCDIGAYEAEQVYINVTIGTSQVGSYPLVPGSSLRQSYPKDDGPVKIMSIDGSPLIASERINLPNHPAVSSYTEFLGMPATKLTDTYLFPWYNNVSLDSQLRIANVGTTSTTVNVKIGTVVDDSFTLGANQSVRKTYNADTGPVTIESSGGVPLIASERVNLLNHPAVSSYTEFIGLSVGDPLGWPGDQLSDTYWFPWYNNVSLDSQLRFGVP